MARLFLCDAAPGDILEDVFVISGKQLAAEAGYRQECAWLDDHRLFSVQYFISI